MTATRQHGSPHARTSAKADIIAPEHHRHVTHFRPIFADPRIIDAEFEEIASELMPGQQFAGARNGTSVSAGRRERAFDRPSFPGRRPWLAADGLRRRPRAFPAVLAGLCALSFWIFGGHAVFARLTGHETADRSLLSLSGLSMRTGAVADTRGTPDDVIFIDNAPRAE